MAPESSLFILIGTIILSLQKKTLMIPDLNDLLFHIKTKAFTLVLLVAMLLASCGSKQVIATGDEHFPPKLIFLNYRITALENGEKSVQFINQIITDGKLKRHSHKYIEQGAPGDLECHQLDENSNTIQTVIIKDPLKKHIEYLNDSLNYKTKHVDLNSDAFALKLKLEPQARYVSINEIQESENTSRLLIKTKLYE